MPDADSGPTARGMRDALCIAENQHFSPTDAIVFQSTTGTAIALSVSHDDRAR
jgi:hypothetical protein